MAENQQHRQRIVVDAVAFGQIFQFHRILRAVTQAMQPPRLVVALLMVLALTATGKLWDDWIDDPSINPQGLLVADPLYSELTDTEAQALLRPIAERSEATLRRLGYNSNDPNAQMPDGAIPARVVYEGVSVDFRYDRREAIEAGVNPQQLARDLAAHRQVLRRIESVRARGAFEASAEQVSGSVLGIVDGVFGLDPRQVFDAFADLFVRTPVVLWDLKPWFVVIYGLIAIVIIAVGGGALCRMAACELAGRERLRVTDAYLFAFAHWMKLVGAPLLPLIIAGVLALVLVVMGLILFGIPWVDVLGGIFYGVNLLVGFLIAFVLIAFAASFFMVLPAVATENCGPADALQRAYAYLLSRPLHLLGYAIVGLVGLAIGYIVVSLFAVATLNITGASTEAFTSNSAISIAGGFEIFDLEPAPGDYHDDTHSGVSATLVALWQGLVILLVASYIVSFMFSCSTIIYMLMRKSVDDQDYAEIWREGFVPGTLAPMPRPPQAYEDEVGSESTGQGTAPSSPRPIRNLRQGNEDLTSIGKPESKDSSQPDGSTSDGTEDGDEATEEDSAR